MKVLIFGGGGNIGSVIAWDLARTDGVDAIGLVDNRQGALEQTRDWINSKKIVLHPLDIVRQEEVSKLMKQYDVGVISLPDRRSSYRVVEAALEAGLNIVDVLGEYHCRPSPDEVENLPIPDRLSPEEYGESLFWRAVESGITVVDGIGFAPGISNILVAEGMRKMDEAESAVVRVGGIPTKEAAQRYPLNYMITWAFGNVLREYVGNVKVIKNGDVVEVNAGSDYERFRFSKFGRDEDLECAITPGMPSFIYTRPDLREFSEKTIRWPGHWQGIKALKECGLLDLDPIEHDGSTIVPREFLATLMEPKLKPAEGDTDVCVMWNTLIGTKDGKRTKIDHYMWEGADLKEDISAMARVTGFPASIAAIMMGEGEIKRKGIHPPEDCIEGFVYHKFMDELWNRKITILEERSEIA